LTDAQDKHIFHGGERKEARQRRAKGATLKELAEAYNVGRATISRLAG